jgi:hypothetical protein
VLDVRVSESGASVWIDGSAFPVAGVVPAGRHNLQVTRAGYEPWTEALRLQPGERRKLEVVLVPTRGRRAELRARAESQRFWALAFAGTGAALGIAAAGIYVWNDGRHGDWQAERDALDAEAAKGPPFAPDLAARQRENDRLLGSIRDWDRIDLGVGIAGGALLTTGIVLLMTGDSPSRHSELAGLRPAPGGAVLTWASAW